VKNYGLYLLNYVLLCPCDVNIKAVILRDKKDIQTLINNGVIIQEYKNKLYVGIPETDLTDSIERKLYDVDDVKNIPLIGKNISVPIKKSKTKSKTKSNCKKFKKTKVPKCEDQPTCKWVKRRGCVNK